jgi:hypothetical protein
MLSLGIGTNGKQKEAPSSFLPTQKRDRLVSSSSSSSSSPWAKKYSLPLMPIVDPDDTRPTSLLECQDDNWEMDDERFRLFQEREDDEKENVMINMVSMIARLQSSIDDDSDEGEQEPVAKKRRKSKREVMYTDADGTKHPLETRETWWYSALCRQP